MYLSAKKATEDSEESSPSNKNETDDNHFSTLFVKEDSERESESWPSPHNLSPDSLRLCDEGGNYSFESDVQDSRSFLDGFGDNVCEYTEIEDINSPVIILYPNANSEESSPLITNTDLTSRPDRFSVRYSLSETKSLISDDSFETGSGHTNNSQVWANPFQPRLPFVRTSSLSNMSDLALSTLNIDPPLAASNLAAPSSPNSVCNSDTEAASCMGSPSSQCNPFNNFNSSIVCSTCRPYPEVGQDCLSNATQPTESFKIVSKLPSSSQFQRCFSDIPLKLMNKNRTDPEAHFCSDHAYSCISSFCQSDNSTRVNFPLNVTSRAPHFSSPQELRMSCALNNGADMSGTNSNTSTTANSTAMALGQNIQSVLGYGTPIPVSALKKRSKSLPYEGETPLQVLVPRGQVIPQEINQTLITDNVNYSPIPYDHKSRLHNSLLSLFQHPPPNSTYYTKTSPAHTDLDSKEDSTFSMKNNVFGDFTKIFTVGETVSPENANPPTSIQTSQQNTSHQTFESPQYSQQHCSCGNIITVYHPIKKNNQSTRVEPFTVIKAKENAQIYASENVDASLSKTSCSQSLVIVNQCLNEAPQSQSRNLGNRSALIASNYLDKTGHYMCATKPNKSNSSESRSKSEYELMVQTNADTTSHGLHAFQSNDTYQDQRISPSTQLALDYFSVHSKPGRHNVRKNKRDQPGQFDLIRCNQQARTSDICDHGGAISSVQTDDNVYRPGLILDVPRSYYDTKLVDSHEHLIRSKKGQVRDSIPSSIDSGHPVNKEESIQRSNMSEFGLLKVSSESTRIPGYSDRDAPNYSYLCIVATVLNPLFGLAAFLCNHYARRNFRLQRHVQANNLYFASITISTVAIFLTLVGAALLITHNIVVHSEKKPSTAAPLTESCEGRFFGYDDSLKKFFSIDFTLYCEVTKNEKVMEALKRFWLEDIHNKKKFINPTTDFEDNNSTLDGQLLAVNASNDSKDDTSLKKDSVNEASSNIVNVPPGSLDYNEKHNHLDVSGLTDNKAAHNTIVSSSDGPVVPPELEEEYRQYLEGKRRTKVEDVSLLSQEDRPVQPSSSLEDRPISGTISNIISTNISSGEVDEPHVTVDTLMVQNGHATNKTDVE